MNRTGHEGEGLWWVLTVIICLLLLIGLAIGAYMGRGVGRNQGCRDLCDTQYAWWGNGVCICAEGKNQ